MINLRIIFIEINNMIDHATGEKEKKTDKYVYI